MRLVFRELAVFVHAVADGHVALADVIDQPGELALHADDRNGLALLKEASGHELADLLHAALFLIKVGNDDRKVVGIDHRQRGAQRGQGLAVPVGRGDGLDLLRHGLHHIAVARGEAFIVAVLAVKAALLIGAHLGARRDGSKGIQFTGHLLQRLAGACEIIVHAADVRKILRQHRNLESIIVDVGIDPGVISGFLHARQGFAIGRRQIARDKARHRRRAVHPNIHIHIGVGVDRGGAAALRKRRLSIGRDPLIIFDMHLFRRRGIAPAAAG